jgi:putative FmdB family regulatory protein
MPIYEYACTSCGFEKDFLQKMSEPALTECPACHQSSLVKKLSAPGFQLKGSGWYATDFKGGTSSSAKKTETESSAAPVEAVSTSETSAHACGQGGCGACA